MPKTLPTVAWTMSLIASLLVPVAARDSSAFAIASPTGRLARLEASMGAAVSSIVVVVLAIALAALPLARLRLSNGMQHIDLTRSSDVHPSVAIVGCERRPMHG